MQAPDASNKYIHHCCDNCRLFYQDASSVQKHLFDSHKLRHISPTFINGDSVISTGGCDGENIQASVLMRTIRKIFKSQKVRVSFTNLCVSF